MEQDQGRLRSNISTLRNVAGQQQKVQGYADKLAGQESDIVLLRDRLNELRVLKDELQSVFNQLIEYLEI